MLLTDIMWGKLLLLAAIIWDLGKVDGAHKQ